VATTSVTRNLVTAELRGNELADKPLQRDGVLRGQTVVVDARVGTASGNKGTDLADVSGQVALIGKDVLERTSRGGAAIFDSAVRWCGELHWWFDANHATHQGGWFHR
jgi:filamentous hemagglutinin